MYISILHTSRNTRHRTKLKPHTLVTRYSIYIPLNFIASKKAAQANLTCGTFGLLQTSRLKR